MLKREGENLSAEDVEKLGSLGQGKIVGNFKTRRKLGKLMKEKFW
jgi:hypothetical protein